MLWERGLVSWKYRHRALLRTVIFPRTERDRLSALAERLHPGASEVAVFRQWLERSPLRPTRFLALLDARLAHPT